MYCKRCSAKLPTPPEDPLLATGKWLGGQPGQIPYASPRPGPGRCPYCLKRFDPNNPKTFLTTLVLSPGKILWRIFLTTLFGIAAAYVVAFHQLAQGSGH
jgi:hypothetical protein